MCTIKRQWGDYCVLWSTWSGLSLFSSISVLLKEESPGSSGERIASTWRMNESPSSIYCFSLEGLTVKRANGCILLGFIVRCWRVFSLSTWSSLHKQAQGRLATTAAAAAAATFMLLRHVGARDFESTTPHKFTARMTVLSCHYGGLVSTFLSPPNSAMSHSI